MLSLIEERKLRKVLRKTIIKYFENLNNDNKDLVYSVLQEHKLRMNLRSMILEVAVEDPTVDVHDNTGINTLKDLLKSTNVLSTLRNVYKTLTTDDNQRRSFRAHAVKWIQDTLAPIKVNDLAPEPADAAMATISEINDVDIDVTDSDRDKFIDVDDGSPAQEPDDVEDEDNSMDPIEGEDTTGRNKAERVYPTIEKSIIDYYGELDNSEDQELFYDYLIANVKLYFDKWEGEMTPHVEEPTNDAYDSAVPTPAAGMPPAAAAQ